MPIPKRSAAPASYILCRVDGIGLKVFDLDRPIREVSLCRWYKISVRSEPLSAMKGSAARTKLIWPMPLALIELAHCSSVVCSRGAGKTSPAA
jgi:hypothetical protein